VGQRSDVLGIGIDQSTAIEVKHDGFGVPGAGHYDLMHPAIRSTCRP
jgi:hypothetical protein